MPSFRDRERDEAEAQAKKTAAQREELKKRAAKRAARRRRAARDAATPAAALRQQRKKEYSAAKKRAPSIFSETGASYESLNFPGYGFRPTSRSPTLLFPPPSPSPRTTPQRNS